MDQLAQKQAAKKFVERWRAEEGNEDRQSRSFWIEFAQDVMGISNPTYVLDFERKVRGRKIDVFYEDMGVLIEQKSRGIDLDEKSVRSKKVGEETPYQQAKWYADNLPYSARPRWIVVSNFDEFRIYDLDIEDPEGDYTTVTLEELPEKLYLFGFLIDKSASRLVKEQELSVQAGEIVGRLYRSLSAQYKNIDTDPVEQRSLNVLIVRFVFLLYAEDAGLLQEHQAFLNYMRDVEPEDMRGALMQLFEVLDTPEGERDPYLSEHLAAFPYINGSLFAKADIVIPQFTQQIKYDLLKEASQDFDWSGISPTIFGAAFESTLNPETRRAGGMHYTSIENIHKVIGTLFLDDLKAELVEIEGERVEKTRNLKLRQFQNKLASIKILDPACGSGNFLTESYLCLRKLENRVLESLHGDQLALGFSSGAGMGGGPPSEANPIKVSIDQLYGIEINDFAVAVSKSALWIAERQTLELTQEILMTPLQFLPLTSNENIVQANALRYDWNDLLLASKCDYIIGNPPFYGARMQSKEQKAEIQDVFHGAKNCGNVDYVAGWYMKAAEYMQDYPIRAAFVSTNSICQGEQVANIWEPIFKLGFHIDFAYDTFRWKNEANDQAHVFVVIVGFSKQKAAKTLFHHETPDSQKEALTPSNINAYLIDAPNVFIWNRAKPISNVPSMRFGSMPNDGGNLLLTEDDLEAMIRKDSASEKFIKPFMGASEFINNRKRWCIWLQDAPEGEYIDIGPIAERVAATKKYRESSSRSATNKLASTPQLFGEIRQPQCNYVFIPRHSSERRRYVPLGYLPESVICGDSASLLPDASLYHFGVMMSQFHNAWMRTVAGRIKSDYRYSNGIVYNNFIWPNSSPEQRLTIEQAAQVVLDVRAAHLSKSLAELYDPDKMPSDLLAAHKALDKAVEVAYGVDFNGDEEKIVAHLFKLYAGTTKEI